MLRQAQHDEGVPECVALRSRPIMMTTCAMIVSMLPVALAFDPGAAVRRSLGIVVIGGLLSSLLLTLLLVPVIYARLAPTGRSPSPARSPRVQPRLEEVS